MGGCKLRLRRKVNLATKLTLRIFGKLDTEDQDEKLLPFDPIMATVRWCRPSKEQEDLFSAGVSFDTRVSYSHGVPQLINPEQFKKKPLIRKVKSNNSSLMGKTVTCYACGHSDILSWSLRSKIMRIKNNIFGVPVFVKPIGNNQYCDYNLCQITVCSQCFFAANGKEYFQINDLNESPFQNEEFYQVWKNSIAERKSLVADLEENFYSEERNYEQALVAYELAVRTFQQMIAIEPKNVNAQRKVVNIYLTYAEMLIRNPSYRSLAHEKLKLAAEILTAVFESLAEEHMIRAALVNSVINLYFGNTKNVGLYMRFLDNFDKDGKLNPKSDKAKLLRITRSKLNDIFQERDLYKADNLSNFFLHEE